MRSVASGIPISRVTRDGQVERLGEWHHESRTLELEREGFPFLGPGRHVIEGELPWIVWDMSPCGYLGSRLQQRFPALRLSANPRDWIASDVLRVLQDAGADLSGNLLIGDASTAAFKARAPVAEDPYEALGAALEQASTSDRPSFLGGERPKILLDTPSGSGVLVKFAPSRDAPHGARWNDLLRVESLCTSTLRSFEVSASESHCEDMGRTWLVVRRFDRLHSRGRVGTGSLYWLAFERYGDIQLSAPEVMRRLADEGLVSTDDAETCRRVHAFSAAIGNNDTHLGNYGLLFDDHGRASLAPIYDVLPMMLAPQSDELPDAYIRPLTGETDPLVVPWVDALVAAIEADSLISDEFKTLWRRLIGR